MGGQIRGQINHKGNGSFLKKHNDAKRTTCVITDKDWVEQDVIEGELPHATLICLFHTLRTFLEVLEEMAYSVNETEYATHRDALMHWACPSVRDILLSNCYLELCALCSLMLRVCLLREL
ncbi:hypothetical protein PoB_004421900 [Plakobranchus ocellatus]|uniref:Uncharacterized protein n=1 Tax=Plakobranchus ocellatus TaxID=259542 RepID=A0AAV4BH94_9GAST|nr:hypothetical protein PoB_004421900 [Plakobranchus ocellatus]